MKLIQPTKKFLKGLFTEVAKNLVSFSGLIVSDDVDKLPDICMCLFIEIGSWNRFGDS